MKCLTTTIVVGLVAQGFALNVVSVLTMDALATIMMISIRKNTINIEEGIMWVEFNDMHSGGGKKTKYEAIFIEAASEEKAEQIFRDTFNRDPNHVTCSCCGPDYSVSSDECLRQLTAYERNCQYRGATQKYAEEQDESRMDIRKRCNTAASDPWGLYVTLAKFKKNPKYKFIAKGKKNV
jgi:hypothetical protein